MNNYEETYRWAHDALERLQVAAAEGDHEKSHGLEDGVMSAILATIATPGACDIDQARLLAQLAMTTKDVAFHRWCA